MVFFPVMEEDNIVLHIQARLYRRCNSKHTSYLQMDKI